MYDLEAMISRIKALKKASKLSNEALANLAGIPKGTLSKILGSETKDPQISNIIKIRKLWALLLIMLSSAKKNQNTTMIV